MPGTPVCVGLNTFCNSFQNQGYQGPPVTAGTMIKHGCRTCTDTKNNLEACRWRMLIALKIEYWWKNGDDQLIYIDVHLLTHSFIEKHLALLSLLNLHQRRLNDVKHTSRDPFCTYCKEEKGGSLASCRQSRPLCRLNSTKQGCQTCVDTRNNFDACRWRMLVVSEVEY